MAWITLKEHGTLRIETGTVPRSSRDVIGSAVLVNLLNPKLSIFFFAFLPQFVDARRGGAMLSMAELSLILMAMTFIVFAIYGIFAAAVRDKIMSRAGIPTWMRRSFAAAFVGLGAKLALTDR